MDWIVFSYSLPSKQVSSSRVALWRRLRHWGALSMPGSAYILPAQEECIEAFQWLAQEIRANKGEALIMRVEHFEGLTDQQLIDLFRAARAEDYAELGTQIKALNKAFPVGKSVELAEALSALAKLRRRHADLLRVDYFNCPEGKKILFDLDALEKRFSPAAPLTISIPKRDMTQYHDKVWVTRPHPFVDRLASIWLIRHFINPELVIRYSESPELQEVPFDMNQGEFGHRGNLCTFETIKLAFGLDNPGLRPIGEIVHEIDLHDGRYAWSEIAGIETTLRGWMLMGLSDTEMESLGMSLFEGLFQMFSHVIEPEEQGVKF